MYDRLGPRSKRVLDWFARVLLILCSILLIYAGTQITVTSFIAGDIPPPLSSEILIPAWLWRTFLPLGAGMMLVLLFIDAVRPTNRRGGIA